MSTISINQFVEHIQPYVASAPLHVILNEIMGAIVEFCDESGVIEAILDPVAVQAGDTEFDLDVPPGTRVCRVNALWDTETGCAIMRGEYSLNGDAIRLTYPLSSDMTIAAAVALKPKRSSGRCESDIYEDWLDGIVAGALFRLKSMTGREWADPQGALFNEQMYRRAITKAKHNARTDRVGRLGRVFFDSMDISPFA